MQQIIRPNGQYCAKKAVAGCLLWRKRIGQPLSGVKCLQQLLFASGCIVAGHLLFIWGKISVWQPDPKYLWPAMAWRKVIKVWKNRSGQTHQPFGFWIKGIGQGHAVHKVYIWPNRKAVAVPILRKKQPNYFNKMLMAGCYMLKIS